jgi:hypothetical protein
MTAPVTPTTPTATPSAPASTWHIHLYYIVLALGCWYGTHTWLQEHDQRMAAEAALKSTVTQVANLQTQIKDRDTASAKQQQVIVKVIHDTVTPTQAVAAIPSVTAPLPKPITLDANQDMIIPEPDVVQIFDQLADDKLCRVQLSTAAADLVDEKSIAAGLQTEVTTLKKKPSFIKRVKHDAKIIGIGIAIGGLLVAIH